MAGPPTHYIPPPPPPPPPGWGDPAFMSKPTSGKAIASLILGLVGLVGIFCWFPVLGSLVGVILGILGLIETGREGPRRGRGMAIAGTITSVLAMCAFGAYISFIFVMARHGAEQQEQHTSEQLDADQRIILERLKQYYDLNDQSLGPGGPVLADSTGKRRSADPSGMPAANRDLPANSGPPANNGPDFGRPRVSGVLELSHLVDETELTFATHSGITWELAVTGKASATLRAKGWSNDVIREIAIQDIGRNLYAQTIP